MGDARACSRSRGARRVASPRPIAARANEADTYGLGSRSSAMAGAVAADATDFSANYYNPAGLASARGDRALDRLHATRGTTSTSTARTAASPTSTASSAASSCRASSSACPSRSASPRTSPTPASRASRRFAKRRRAGSSTAVARDPLPRREPRGAAGAAGSRSAAASPSSRATQGSFEISGNADVQHPLRLAAPPRGRRRSHLDPLPAGRPPRAPRRLRRPRPHLPRRDQAQALASTRTSPGQRSTSPASRCPLLYTLETHTIDAFLPQQFVLGVQLSTRRAPARERRPRLRELGRLREPDRADAGAPRRDLAAGADAASSSRRIPSRRSSLRRPSRTASSRASASSTWLPSPARCGACRAARRTCAAVEIPLRAGYRLRGVAGAAADAGSRTSSTPIASPSRRARASC